MKHEQCCKGWETLLLDCQCRKFEHKCFERCTLLVQPKPCSDLNELIYFNRNVQKFMEAWIICCIEPGLNFVFLIFFVSVLWADLETLGLAEAACTSTTAGLFHKSSHLAFLFLIYLVTACGCFVFRLFCILCSSFTHIGVSILWLV